MRDTLRHTAFCMLMMWTLLSIAPASATAEPWLDDLAAVLADHRNFARAEGRAAAYDPYIAQLNVARVALERGEVEDVYAAMNRFMDMLKHGPEASGIPLWSAEALFDYCAEVTPPMYHDLSRHGAKKTV